MLMKLVMLTAPASYCESDYKERREARGEREKEKDITNKVEERKKNRIGRKERQNKRIRWEESKQKEDTKKGEEEKKKDKVTCSFVSFPAYTL